MKFKLVINVYDFPRSESLTRQATTYRVDQEAESLFDAVLANVGVFASCYYFDIFHNTSVKVMDGLYAPGLVPVYRSDSGLLIHRVA